MDQQQNQSVEQISTEAPTLDTLHKEHRDLDQLVSDLTNKSHLTPEEDLELHRLKKEKLKLKDQIEMLMAQEKSA